MLPGASRRPARSRATLRGVSGWVLGVVAAVLGLAVGRAVNVLAQRVVARRPDAAELLPGDRLTRPAAVRPPWVELGVAALVALVAVRFGPVPLLPAWLWLAACAALLIVVDLQHQLLPNRVLLPATVGGVLLLAGEAAVTGAWAGLGRGVLAAVAVFGVLLALALVNPSGLGLGDVKLGLLLGLYLGRLGWDAVVAGLVVAFVVQAGAALVLLALRRADRRTQLPFGPSLLAAALLMGVLTAG